MMRQFTWIKYGHCKTSKVIFEVFHTRKKWSSSHESSKAIAKPVANWSTTPNVCFNFNILVPHKLSKFNLTICTKILRGRAKPKCAEYLKVPDQSRLAVCIKSYQKKTSTSIKLTWIRNMKIHISEKIYVYILTCQHCPIKRLNGGFSEGEGFLLSLIQKYFGHNRPNS